MKIVQYVLANLGRLHVIHQKVEAAYDLWNTIYQKLALLLPQHVAPTAQATAAVQEPAQPAPPAPDTVPAVAE